MHSCTHDNHIHTHKHTCKHVHERAHEERVPSPNAGSGGSARHSLHSFTHRADACPSMAPLQMHTLVCTNNSHAQAHNKHAHACAHACAHEERVPSPDASSGGSTRHSLHSFTHSADACPSMAPLHMHTLVCTNTRTRKHTLSMHMHAHMKNACQTRTPAPAGTHAIASTRLRTARMYVQACTHAYTRTSQHTCKHTHDRAHEECVPSANAGSGGNARHSSTSLRTAQMNAQACTHAHTHARSGTHVSIHTMCTKNVCQARTTLALT